MIIVDWANITLNALQDTWRGIISYLPKLFGALIVFIIGWFIANFVGKIVSEVLKKIGLNQLFNKMGWKEALAKAELKVNPAEFIGGIFKWMIIIVFLSSVVGDVLGFHQFQAFLNDIV